MIPSDYNDVLGIDFESFTDDWSMKDLLRCLHNRHNIGTVLTDGKNRPIAYCIYGLYRDSIQILRMAVDTRYRRCGMATAMIQRLKEKMLNMERQQIVEVVEGYQLHAQLTFAANGFTGSSMGGDRISFAWTR
jgi:ribosomal protein S18 acetylase RimI-like enzyme